MPQAMGLGFGLGSESVCFKRKFRWLLKIDGISASGAQSLPPDKSARPSLTFKEIEVQHLNETVYFPGKPEWKPISLVLFDLKRNRNPVFDWLKKQYNPCNGRWLPPTPNEFKKTARLELYDGCGNIMETWVFENAWPNALEWGDLDMSNSEYVTVDLTLRYDRAYIEEECGGS